MKINFNIFFGLRFQLDYMTAFLFRQGHLVFFYIFVESPE